MEQPNAGATASGSSSSRGGGGGGGGGGSSSGASGAKPDAAAKAKPATKTPRRAVFCAGGDVAAVRQAFLDGDTSLREDFFYEEYQLNHKIATMRELHGALQLSLWDGVVMGGGAGLTVHGAVRVATERTLFAMPETGIGFFPDVGMTYALARLNGGFAQGLYVALTGARLGAHDCCSSGLATHYCPSAQVPLLHARLHEAMRTLHGMENEMTAMGLVYMVEMAIAEANARARPEIVHPGDGVRTSDAAKFSGTHLKVITECFGDAHNGSVEGIVAALEREAARAGDPGEVRGPIGRAACAFAEETLAALRTKSPTSLKVTLEAMRRVRPEKHDALPLGDALRQDYRLAHRFVAAAPASDFCEGVRAVLVDKDRAPRWDPPALADVAPARVEAFFAPLPEGHPRGELDVSESAPGQRKRRRVTIGCPKL